MDAMSSCSPNRCSLQQTKVNIYCSRQKLLHFSSNCTDQYYNLDAILQEILKSLGLTLTHTPEGDDAGGAGRGAEEGQTSGFASFP